MGRLRYLVKWFKARFRTDLAAVCELSKGRGMRDDFHDPLDDEHGYFMCHMVTLKCVRCGKEFFA